MAAAWRVTGEPKEDVAKVVDDREARLRAVRSLAQVPGQAAALLSVPDQVAGDGQGRRQRGRSEEARRRVPGAAARRDVRAARRSRTRTTSSRRRRCRARRRRSRRKLPSDFVTNDDFCPGCGLELKSLPIERKNLWTDVFQRDLQEGFDPGAGVRPHQARAARVPRLGARAAAERRSPALRRRRCAKTSRRCARSSRRSIRSSTASPTSRSRSTCRSACAAARTTSATRCRGISCRS